MKGAEPYQPIRRFIGLKLPASLFDSFPESIHWSGKELFKKDEFHVTICNGEDVFAEAGIDISAGEEKLLTLFNEFVQSKPIKLVSFLDDFRYMKKEEKESVILRCILANISEFFDELNRKFRINMPVQPAHVTLYTLDKNIGIHIPSPEIMERLPKVSIPALDAAISHLQI